MSPLPYYLCYLMPIAFFAGLSIGGWGLFLTPILGFLVIPVADLFFGRDHKNPSPEEEEKIKNAFSFELVTLLWVPTQFLIVFGAFYASIHSLAWWEWVGLLASAGLVGVGESELPLPMNFVIAKADESSGHPS